MTSLHSGSERRVALFVTCLVDLFRPSVGFAAVKLLEDAGCEIVVPRDQTCCGQPAYNSGDKAHTKAIAKSVITAFEAFDTIVIPSGSCGGMLAKHYPEVLADEPDWSERAEAFSAKCHELMSFLVDELGFKPKGASYNGTITYHDSCAGLRELGVKQQPRQLLKHVDGVSIAEMQESEGCCGFGGLFCVKYPDISNSIVERKTSDIADTKADMLLAGDLGCLMNMAGKLKRQNIDIEVRHTAEVLAGMTDTPAIGDGPKR